MQVSSSGTFTIVNLKKKSTCKWNGIIKPIKNKNKTYKMLLNLHVNKDRVAVDVDVSMNSDATLNLLGDMTTTNGKKTIKKHIDLKHYKIPQKNYNMQKSVNVV